MERIVEGVYRLGSEWINWYLVVDGGAVTVIDTGVPGYFSQFEPALRELGRKPSDVKAIVLTHTHADHIGTADRIVQVTDAPVHVHAGEVGFATGSQKPKGPSGAVASLWRPTMLRFVGHFVATGGLKRVTVPKAEPFEDGEVLDVPGRPRVVYCPGHSPGHSALVLEDRRVLFAGDALATLAVDTGATGPMVHPFSEDRATAIGSLAALENVDADLVLAGHGDPFQGAPRGAVAVARGRLQGA